MHLSNVKEAIVFDNVTIQNPSSMGRGGAISTQSDGEQKAHSSRDQHLTFENSEAYNYGGAIAMGTAFAPWSYSSLTVNASEFRNNTTDDSQDGYGGAIIIFGTDTQHIPITSSTFSENIAELRGGALFVQKHL